MISADLPSTEKTLDFSLRPSHHRGMEQETTLSKRIERIADETLLTERRLIRFVVERNIVPLEHVAPFLELGEHTELDVLPESNEIFPESAFGHRCVVVAALEPLFSILDEGRSTPIVSSDLLRDVGVAHGSYANQSHYAGLYELYETIRAVLMKLGSEDLEILDRLIANRKHEDPEPN